jgi:hypothetical protein
MRLEIATDDSLKIWNPGAVTGNGTVLISIYKSYPEGYIRSSCSKNALVSVANKKYGQADAILVRLDNQEFWFEQPSSKI